MLHKHLEYHDRPNEVFPATKRYLKIWEPSNKTLNISIITNMPTYFYKLVNSSSYFDA
jgi:hypothetical protein